MSVDIYSKIEYNVKRKGIFMKRIIMASILILLVFCSCKQKQKPISVSVETSSVEKQKNRYHISHFETLAENHSVGSDWETGVRYEGQEIVSRSQIVFDGEQLELILYAIEKDDKIDDVGEKVIAFSELAIDEEETKTELVEVVENGGSTKGNTATWRFHVTVHRLS